MHGYIHSAVDYNYLLEFLKILLMILSYLDICAAYKTSQKNYIRDKLYHQAK